MKIIYVARHDQPNSNDDEGAILHALRALGHEVEPLREHKASKAIRLRGDLVLFHKCPHPAPWLSFFQGKCPRVFWYFDMVHWDGDPALLDRSTRRQLWMDEVLPHVELGFCTDGDWVAQDSTGKLHWLMQGADERLVGQGQPHGPPIPVLFTGTVKGCGQAREFFLQEMRQTLGTDLLHVDRGHYGADLRTLIASTEVVVAPDSPVTDRYWSNRVYLTLGYGGFLLHPYSTGLAGQYRDRDDLVFYHSRDHLHDLLASYRKFPKVREHIAAGGLARTLKEHLYRHRLQVLLQTVQEKVGVNA